MRTGCAIRESSPTPTTHGQKHVLSARTFNIARKSFIAFMTFCTVVGLHQIRAANANANAVTVHK
jgi:hypothetical protein